MPFRTHHNGEYPERKFDWNNLFFACGHYNNVKNQQKYDSGIIDCCRDDPEELIWFRFYEKEPHVLAKDEKNAQAVLTAQLVTEVFNKKNTGLRVYTSAHRLEALTKEMNKLYDALEELSKNKDSVFALRKAKALLRHESAFAAFKRNYIQEHQDRYPQLAEYVD